MILYFMAEVPDGTKLKGGLSARVILETETGEEKEVVIPMFQVPVDQKETLRTILNRFLDRVGT